MNLRNIRAMILVTLATSACSGCLESSFRLADNSRIPYFFQVKEGTNRDDLYVTLDYYSTFSGGEVVFKLYHKEQFFKLDKVVVEQNDEDHMLELKSPPLGYPKGYPSYEIVRARGVVDVIEHRQMEPIFYTTDDPIVWKEFGLTR